MEQPTLTTVIITIVSTIGVILSGGFGLKLLAVLAERNARSDASKEAAAKLRTDATTAASKLEYAATAAASRLQTEDNEQARDWLRAQLDELESERKEFRTRERELIERVSTLAEAVARQEERSSAQAIQITTLQKQVEQWGRDYTELKAERDRYRDEKHDAVNKLAPAVLEASMLRRDIETRDAEIERLKGQVAAMTSTPVVRPLDRSTA